MCAGVREVPGIMGSMSIDLVIREMERVTRIELALSAWEVGSVVQG